jgi:hypothetical protein
MPCGESGDGDGGDDDGEIRESNNRKVEGVPLRPSYSTRDADEVATEAQCNTPQRGWNSLPVLGSPERFLQLLQGHLSQEV